MNSSFAIELMIVLIQTHQVCRINIEALTIDTDHCSHALDCLDSELMCGVLNISAVTERGNTASIQVLNVEMGAVTFG